MMIQVKRWTDGSVICKGATARKACGRAVRERVSLAFADLMGAVLADADLAGAVLADADLAGADLADADLTGADLADADLTGANLTSAKMPDGRTWEAYRLDPLAGICHTPEARERARAATGHTWSDCPMHEGNGYDRILDAPEAERVAVAAFVAVYDAGLLGEEWRTA